MAAEKVEAALDPADECLVSGACPNQSRALSLSDRLLQCMSPELALRVAFAVTYFVSNRG
jgi:hypothetical protein